jgi:glycosyltransferase involved in cell wall biosynthesis
MTRFLVPPAPADLPPATPPRFSVIVACYEAAETIAEAVESALNQTYPPVEVVVCDDGSRDDPAAALAPYMDRIVFFSQENAGPSEARNAAIARAGGDFIVNLDSDDTLAPTSLQARAELLRERPDLDIVCTNGEVVLDGEVLRHLYREDWTFEVEDQRTEILRRCFIIFWAARREKILAAGGFDPAITHAEDWDLWLRMIVAGSRAGFVDEPLGIYRLHHGSRSTANIGLLQARIGTLEKAISSGELNDEEVAIAQGVIDEDRSEQRLARVTAALLDRSPDARRLSRELMLSPGLGAAARLRAAVAWVAPGLARRALSRRPVQTAAGVELPPD